MRGTLQPHRPALVLRGIPLHRHRIPVTVHDARGIRCGGARPEWRRPDRHSPTGIGRSGGRPGAAWATRSRRRKPPALPPTSARSSGPSTWTATGGTTSSATWTRAPGGCTWRAGRARVRPSATRTPPGTSTSPAARLPDVTVRLAPADVDRRRPARPGLHREHRPLAGAPAQRAAARTCWSARRMASATSSSPPTRHWAPSPATRATARPGRRRVPAARRCAAGGHGLHGERRHRRHLHHQLRLLERPREPAGPWLPRLREDPGHRLPVRRPARRGRLQRGDVPPGLSLHRHPGPRDHPAQRRPQADRAQSRRGAPGPSRAPPGTRPGTTTSPTCRPRRWRSSRRTPTAAASGQLARTTRRTLTWDFNHGAPVREATTVSSPASSTVFNTTVTRVYDETARVAQYCLGLPLRVDTTRDISSASASTRTTQYTWSSATCRQLTETTGAARTPGADSWSAPAPGTARGQLTELSRSPADLSAPARRTTWTYNSWSDRPVTETALIAGQAAPVVDLRLEPRARRGDLPHVAPRRSSTRWSWDEFARVRQETRADGPGTTWSYSRCSGGCFSNRGEYQLRADEERRPRLDDGSRPVWANGGPGVQPGRRPDQPAAHRVRRARADRAARPSPTWRESPSSGSTTGMTFAATGAPRTVRPTRPAAAPARAGTPTSSPAPCATRRTGSARAPWTPKAAC